jgi:signal transduction histidine kinase/ActR/RegA family two-component response regulator
VTPAGPRRGALWWVPAGALLAGALLLLPPLQPLSRPLLDMQQRAAAPATPPPGVAVVDIDDASLAALRDTLGPWPYRRGVYALLVEQMREAGARAIAIDLLLADAHEGDAALARALARPGAPVVLGAAGLRHGGDDALPPPAPSTAGVGGWPAQPWPTLALPARSVWPAPDTPPPLGVITTPLDDDGQLRTLPLWHEAQGRRWPAMPLAVWQVVDGAASGAPQGDWPLTRDGRVWLALAGPDGAPPVLPLAQVMRARPEALQASVKGRVIFIGSSALLADTVMTSGGQASGTAVLAMAYAALRDRNTLRSPPPGSAAGLLAIGLLPALWLAWRGRAVPARDAAAAGAAAGVILAGMAWALWGARMPTNGLPALTALLAGLALGAVAHLRRLAERERQLEYENAVTAAASQAKTEFLANVSHEIRTPMNALLGVAELLAETELTPAQRRHVDVFRQSGQALHDLINDLLDISKIEAGRFELDHAPFALPAVLDQLMALMRPRAEQKGVQLLLQRSDDLPARVVGDRKRLEQVLLNLLGNALKFTAVGSITLSAAVERAAGGAPGGLRFEVRDTGIGIVPSKLEAIFEPFTQADTSITRHYGGTGLGLAITRSVVRLMGGRIEVDSTPGEGSRFVVVVPLQVADGPAAESDAEATAPRAGAAAGPRLLLAEDNEVNVYLFEAMLQGSGAQVDTAPNGPTALQMAEARRYDLIFMDVQMPGMDGLTVTRRLRDFEAAQGRRRTPVVALTANAYASDVQASVAAGCDAHLSKPYTRQQLVALVTRWAASARPEAPAVAAMPPPGVAQPALDPAAALARLGGNRELFDRVHAHAAVFAAQWAQDFELARSGGHHERMQALARDLAVVAESIAAGALADAARRLAATLQAGGDDTPDEVLQALGPVIVALTRADEAPSH